MGSNAHFTVLSNWKDRVFSPFLNCALVMPIASSTVSACTVNAILQLIFAGYLTTYFGMTAISLQNCVYLPVHCYPCSQAKRIRVCIVKKLEGHEPMVPASALLSSDSIWTFRRRRQVWSGGGMASSHSAYFLRVLHGLQGYCGPKSLLLQRVRLLGLRMLRLQHWALIMASASPAADASGRIT